MKAAAGPAFSRAEALLAACCGLAAFLLYLRTLAPTVLYYSPETFDSGHLQVVANVLGIPSYTGYPTYVILANLFTFLPFGDPAYRVNLASAAFGALAVALLFLLCRRLGAGRTASTAAALAFGLSRAFWSQAVIAEVYTLHVLLVALFFLTLLVWRENREEPGGERFLLLAAFLGGLAMTNHLTSVFLPPSALLFFAAVAGWRRLLDVRLVAKAAGLFALGLLPYLYLPLRAATGPPLVDAGPAGNPATLAGFVDLVSGGEHKGRMFAFGPAELPGRLATFGTELVLNLNPALLLLSLAGLVVLLLHDRAALLLLGAYLVFNLVYALEYDIEDLPIYFVPTYLVLAFFLARGAHALLSWGRRRRSLFSNAAAVLLFAVVLAGVPFAYADADRSGDLKGKRMVETVAEGVAPGSTVLYHGRTLHYMQLVEGRRTDVRLADPFYEGDWVGRAEEALERGRVYVLYPGATNTRLYREAGYELVPVREGMLYEVVKTPA